MLNNDLLEELKILLGEEIVSEDSIYRFIEKELKSGRIKFNTTMMSIGLIYYLHPYVKIDEELNISINLHHTITLIFTNIKVDSPYPSIEELMDAIYQVKNIYSINTPTQSSFIPVSESDRERLINDNIELLKDIKLKPEFDYYTVRIIIRFLKLGKKDIVEIANQGLVGKMLEVCGYAMCAGMSMYEAMFTITMIPKKNYIFARRIYKKALKQKYPIAYFYEVMVNDSPEKIISKLEGGQEDIIITDLKLSSDDDTLTRGLKLIARNSTYGTGIK